MEKFKRTLNSNGKKLEAYIFIDDLTLGPALGGCRMKKYKSEEDVIFDGERLAAGMTKKSALAGLSLGGGKAIIVGGSGDKSKQLFHEFGEFINSLKGKYITAEDSGTSVRDLEMVAEVAPKYVVGVKSGGGGGDPSPYTAYGVYKGIKACVGSLESKIVAIQGVGHVGFSLIFGFPAQDKKFNEYRHLFPGLINDCKRIVFTDIDSEKIRGVEKMALKPYHYARITHIPHKQTEKIYSVKQDLFSPCALGGVLNDETIQKLAESGCGDLPKSSFFSLKKPKPISRPAGSGCKVIGGSANNQLLKPEHGIELQKRGIIYLPDYAINAGGVINCWFELDAKNKNTSYDTDASIKKCGKIYDTIKEIIERSKSEKRPTSEIADILAKEIIEKAKH